MGTMSINFGPEEEFFVRSHQNNSRYVNELVGLAADGALQNVRKMTARTKASVLLNHQGDLPDTLVKELMKFMGQSK
tara:strand:- start:173 stop:403 length:231 start_codon:yes stop_codon:yes gene_type:complete